MTTAGQDCPILQLILHLSPGSGNREMPPLEWVVRWSHGDEREPAQAAWDAAYDVTAMWALLAVLGEINACERATWWNRDYRCAAARALLDHRQGANWREDFEPACPLDIDDDDICEACCAAVRAAHPRVPPLAELCARLRASPLLEESC